MNVKKKQPELWTASFLKICLINLFIFLSFHSFLPTFPFFVIHLGGDAMTIGIATALFSIAAIVSRPFAGWLIDTKGRKLILILGLIGIALVPMGYIVSSGIALAVILRGLHGGFHAFCSNSAATWATDVIPKERIGEGLGMYGLSTAISTAVAPALGLIIMHAVGFDSLFIVTSIIAIIAIILALSIKISPYRPKAKTLKLKELFEPMALPASLTHFFFMMTFGVVEVYVAIYAHTYNLPSGGIFFIFLAIATLLTRIFLGKTVDSKGEAPLIYTGNLAAILGIIVLVFLHNIQSFILSAIMIGYSFGAIQPSLQSMAMHKVEPERRGAASSTFFVSFDLGIALGGFLSGILIELLGYNIMFLLISFSCLISLSYYHFFASKHISSFNK